MKFFSPKAIIEKHLVVYKYSEAKSGQSHNTSWRKKYIGLTGPIFIIKNNDKQYFQWHPLESDEVVYTKGMVSSNNDYVIKDDMLTIYTQNSIYYFNILHSENKINPPPALW